MKTRIISALVGTVILFAVLLCPYTIVFAVATAILAELAIWELLNNTGMVKNWALIFGSMVFAVIQVLSFYFLGRVNWIVAMAYVLFVIIFLLRKHETVTITQGAYALFATFYAVIGFAAMTGLRVMGGTEKGLLYVLLLLVIPWMSDTGAYFTGVFFGKHKMTPVISPKKTWEGFAGGLVFSAGCTVLLVFIFQQILPTVTAYWPLWGYALLGLLLAPVSVCGDLFASLIKRQSGIKDYGNLMPGHGGVMDRFDSVLIIAPILYTVMLYFG